MTNSEPLLLPDGETIRIYCEMCFGGLNGLVPIRLLAEKGCEGVKPVLEFPRVGEAAERLLSIAARAADAHRGVFVVPGTVANAGRARANDILQCVVVPVDLDLGDIAAKRMHLEEHLGPASLVVASGGKTETGEHKLHLYWRLAEHVAGTDLSRLASLRGAIAHRVGGDPAFASLHQPIRVAGSVHGKHGMRSPVEVLEQSALTCGIAELEQRLMAMPRFPGLPQAIASGPKFSPSVASLATRRIRGGGVDYVTRFEALSRVIGHWIRQARQGRVSLDQAWEGVRDHNVAMIDPPWEETRLRASFEGLLARDGENHGSMKQPWVDGRAGMDVSNALVFPLGGQADNYTDDAVAQRFARRSAESLRYVAARGGWMIWTGTVWRPDETRSVIDRVRQSLRLDASSANDEGIRRKLGSERVISAVEKLARSDPDLATLAEEWDMGPMLFNTPAGIFDLKTGEILPHRPAALMTRISSAAPEGTCPRWLKFLDEVMGGNTDMITYLQRVAGYCLTGSTREQVFFFLLGSGANGKSVFISVLSRVMGDYAATAPLDAFTTAQGDRHSTDLAGIARARAVFSTETEAGRTWAEARIKAVTGGDRIRVRYLYRDFFEVDPCFKLLVAGNTRPQLTGVGEAMRRRIHVIPFPVTIPKEARDKTLFATLEGELGGILSWMIAGCAIWQKKGLAPPSEVVEAAKSYLDDEDQIGEWLAECCDLGSALQSPSVQLYTSWKGWAERRGFSPGSQKTLGEDLRARGFNTFRSAKQRGWQGLSLRHPIGGRAP